MTATAYLNSRQLRSVGIDCVVVEFEVNRMDGGHVAGPLAEIVEIDGGSETDLESLAAHEGYDDRWEYIYNEFDHELHEVAMDEGPQMESDQYSAYMDAKYHEMKDEGLI